MARVDRPLWGDEAKGKIKSTLTIFPRSGNLECTDADPKEWYHVNFISYKKESESEVRVGYKDLVRGLIEDWRGFSIEEKAGWQEKALPQETGYNAYLRLKIKPEEEEMGFYNGIPFCGLGMEVARLTWAVTGTLADIYMPGKKYNSIWGGAGWEILGETCSFGNDVWNKSSYEDIGITAAFSYSVS